MIGKWRFELYKLAIILNAMTLASPRPFTAASAPHKC